MNDKIKFKYFIMGMVLGAGICFLVGGVLKLTESVEPNYHLSLRIPGGDHKYYSLVLHELPEDVIDMESLDILELWKDALELRHNALIDVAKGKQAELKLLEERSDAMMLRLWDMERELEKLK